MDGTVTKVWHSPARTYEHSHNCVCALCYSEGTPFITAVRGW